MATYLTITNRVLNELNEVELTSSTFSSSRGVQTSVKNFVNRSLHDVYNELEELTLTRKIRRILKISFIPVRSHLS